MKAKWFPILLTALSLMLLLSACGGNNGSNTIHKGNNAGQTSEAASTPEASVTPEAAKFPRTIKDANGEVTIKEQPKKIAVVHWGYADSLLLFNLDSVGLALPFTEKQSVLHSDEYKPYVDKIKDIQIVGENTQVNMEKLLAYAPDLIIAGNAINKDIAADLTKIAPTVMVDEQQTDVWSDWPTLVTKFGEILGQEDVAEQYVSNYKSELAAAKEKLANLDGNVAFVQVRENEVWLQGTHYTKQYYEGMGLTAPASDAMADGEKISLEGLSALDPDYLFLGYFNYSDKTLPAATDQWEDSEVWKKLKAVANNHVYSINGELALGYGPIGSSYGVKAVLEALQK
ncbi:ABC transporter substrate-binding protein [Paenibacillus glycanilyticus]|uniref:ABC transporter substrate-binding protein n=1 Tax=Paenibacillus glycanilyticus TaxID=126569 RepID=UPI002041430F|nr:ABC transporter substrate-binding protein [Paenibacillus glycanilyticus]MCM3629586.1 ABC transporter substrate-binding protein [Paenibacillus glycanilyticus]